MIPGWVKIVAILVLAILTVGTWALLFDAHRTPPSNSYTPAPRVTEEPSPSPADDTEPSATDEQAVIAFIGDGYTTASALGDDESRWTSLVSAALGWEEVNLGIDGAGYLGDLPESGAYADQIEAAVAANPEIVMISGGRNDLGRNGPAVREAAASLFSTLQEQLPDATIVVVSPWWDASPETWEYLNLRDSVTLGAEDAGVLVLETGAPLSDPALFLEGTINPNTDGHAALSDAVLVAIEELGTQEQDVDDEAADEQ